jgi:uncharacterized protein
VSDALPSSDAVIPYADARVERAAGLYEGIVRGRRFVHNPYGWEALAVLSPHAAALLDHADGRAVGEIARATGRPLAALSREVALLARNGFVRGDGIPAARKPPPSPPRFDLWVHLTNACNLDCPYCYIEKDSHALTEEVARTLQRSIVESVREAGLKGVHLRFAGGEPMLRFAFLQRFYEETAELVARAGATLSAAILTNGTRVPDGAPTWIRAHGVGVSVSIDGVGAVQDAMRPAVGGGGSWSAVEEGLARYLDAGVTPYALVTVSRQNLEAMPALTDWLLTRGLGFRYSLVRDLEGGASLLDARSTGWRLAQNLVTLRRKGAERAPAVMLEGEMLARVQAVFAECYDRIEARTPVRPTFRKTHRFCDLEWRRPIRKACAAGEGSLAVSHEGQLSPCQAALHHEGTLTLTGDTVLPRRAPEVSQLGDFTRRRPNETCAGCRFRASCAGGCPLMLYRRDGHVEGRSPYCEVFRAVLPRILRIAALELVHESEARAGG